MKKPANKSKAMTNMYCRHFKLQLAHSGPYRPDLKGHVERAFARLSSKPGRIVTWIPGKDGGL